MAVRWRTIPANRMLGVPAGYEASGGGSVRSVPRTLRDGRDAGGVVLAQQLDKDGYPTVKLGRRRVRVAVAVQLAFAGAPEVRHIDGDKLNSRPENLVWGSRVENEQDKRKTEGNKNREVGGSRPSPIVTAPVTAVADAY